jgi:hypothetical protein
LQRITELFTLKIVIKLSNMVWDPRSGIRKEHIPDPGSRGKKGPGSGSATLAGAVSVFSREFNKSQLPPDVLRGDIASSLIMVS